MFDPSQIEEQAFSYYRRLGRVQEYVAGHYSERLTLGRVATIAGLEKHYFSRFFREKTGVRFVDWLTYVRITHAQDMFATNNTPINRVGRAVGYKNVRTFERAFQRCTGMSPIAFKQSVRPS
jgi:two-component system response regulator YesN